MQDGKCMIQRFGPVHGTKEGYVDLCYFDFDLSFYPLHTLYISAILPYLDLFRLFVVVFTVNIFNIFIFVHSNRSCSSLAHSSQLCVANNNKTPLTIVGIRA